MGKVIALKEKKESKSESDALSKVNNLVYRGNAENDMRAFLENMLDVKKKLFDGLKEYAIVCAKEAGVPIVDLKIEKESFNDFCTSLNMFTPGEVLSGINFLCVGDKNTYYSINTVYMVPDESGQIAVSIDAEIQKTTGSNVEIFDMVKKEWTVDDDDLALKNALFSDDDFFTFTVFSGFDVSSVTDKKYKKLRKTNENIIMLQKEVNRFMDFSMHHGDINDAEKRPENSKVILVPRDDNRIGLAVSYEDGKYHLMQYVDELYMFSSFCDAIFCNCNENVSEVWREVAATESLNEIIACLKNMVDHYADDETITIPYSLESFSDTTVEKTIESIPVGRKLTKEEKENKRAFEEECWKL